MQIKTTVIMILLSNIIKREIKMKRILSLIVCVLLLLKCTVSGFAEDEKLTQLFTPDLFIEALNDHIAFVINAVCSGEDEDTINDIVSYLQLEYTEGDDTYLWYDNRDWLIELTAYFDDGNADANGCAYTMTLSFPAGEEYTLQYNSVGTAACRMLSSVEKTLDFNRFCEYIDNCYYNYMETGNGAYRPVEFKGYQLGILFYNQYDINRCAIALIRDSNADQEIS